MTADRLREAATLLRELAEAATPGPWFADNTYSTVTRAPYKSAQEAYADTTRGSDGAFVIGESFDSGVYGPDLDYIASVSPPVALALADWLDYTASIVTDEDDDTENCDCPYCLGVPKALVVADAILGGSHG